MKYLYQRRDVATNGWRTITTLPATSRRQAAKLLRQQGQALGGAFRLRSSDAALSEEARQHGIPIEGKSQPQIRNDLRRKEILALASKLGIPTKGRPESAVSHDLYEATWGERGRQGHVGIVERRSRRVPRRMVRPDHRQLTFNFFQNEEMCDDAFTCS